jgi:hypothetical protein
MQFFFCDRALAPISLRGRENSYNALQVIPDNDSHSGQTRTITKCVTAITQLQMGNLEHAKLQEEKQRHYDSEQAPICLSSLSILMQFMDDVSAKDNEKLNLPEIPDLKLNS